MVLHTGQRIGGVRGSESDAGSEARSRTRAIHETDSMTRVAPSARSPDSAACDNCVGGDVAEEGVQKKALDEER